MSRNHFSRGFTLAELTIVLIIVGLLLGGMLIPLSAQTDIRYRSDTAKALTDIREALIGYAIVNGRFPCPADQTKQTATGGGTCPTAAGCEAYGGSGAALACTSASGVMPWTTLGVPETDAWGNRYTYQVTLNFARGIPQTTFACTPSVAPTNAAFALCTPGDISIYTAAPTSGGTVLASGIPVAVVSHGKSPVGAWTTSGIKITGAAGTDELENTDDDSNFVSNTTIDDQLIWISPNLLMNRMIAAGKLP